MTDDPFPYIFWLVMFSMGAVCSALMLMSTVYAGRKQASWGWGLSFAGSSLVAAYFLWRLL